MDVTLLIAFASAIVVVIISLTIYLRKNSHSAKQPSDPVGPAAQGGRPVRRAAGVRNARHRIQGNANAQANERGNNRSPDEDDEEEGEEKTEVPDYKMGAKKRAKLEAKAEKKAQREAAEHEREERKKREQLLQEQRDKESEKERAEEQKREEAERKAREEKEKRDYEEYLKMKQAFSVEEEGFDENAQEDEENLLQEFVDHIKKMKVVILEDLAAHFGLKTASVVERIQELQANGTLTGVIDDRGKFIYISQSELEAVAKFVKQRGRVSIAELVENSNRLINLCPEVS